MKLIFLNFLLFIRPTHLECFGSAGVVCCDGYLWDSDLQACRECIPGFVGINCSISCPFPYYGRRCKNVCSCELEYCNVSHGCSQISKRNTVWNKEISADHMTINLQRGTYSATLKASSILPSTLKVTNMIPKLEKDIPFEKSPMFWGLFWINGTILLLVASYVLVRIHKVFRTDTSRKDESDKSSDHERPSQSTVNFDYFVPKTGILQIKENQIYNEIDKSSSEESLPKEAIDIQTFDINQTHEISSRLSRGDIEYKNPRHMIRNELSLSVPCEVHGEGQSMNGEYLTVIS